MGYDVLLFAAHPDDIDFGMGGTYLKLAKKRKVIHIILTRGEAGTFGTPKEREEEARAAAKLAGADIEFLDFKDNHIEDTVANAQSLAGVIRKHQPRIVFAPYHAITGTHTDPVSHPDHVALGALVLKACRFARFKNAPIDGERHNVDTIVYYMMPRGAQPSLVIDVSDVVEQMQDLWLCYKSQLNLREGQLPEALLQFRRYAGMLYGGQYAETFIIDRPLKLGDDDLLRV